MTKSISLPKRMDSSAAKELAEDILKHIGNPITLEASAVETCGALCLQVLVATKKQWDGDGVEASLQVPSDSLLDACKILGVAPAEIGYVEAA